MNTWIALLRRHPVTTYFCLAFCISWGGVLWVIGGPSGLPATPEENERLFPTVYLAMLAGPSLAGLLAHLLVNGWAGLRELGTSLTRWRVGVRWYVVALLTAPLLTLAVQFALSRRAREFVPAILQSENRAQTLLFAVLVGLGAGVFEELGWSGFAIPRLRLRHGVLATGLFVGALWGAWHILVNVWASANAWGEVSWEFLLPVLLSTAGLGMLPAYRVLMVWVQDRTQSLLIAVLMHVSLTTTFIALQTTAKGRSLVVYELVWAGSLWLILAALGVFHRRTLPSVSDPRPSARATRAPREASTPPQAAVRPPGEPGPRTAGAHGPRT